MRKNFLLMLTCVFVFGLYSASQGLATEMSNYELTQKIKELEEKVGLKSPAQKWADKISISGLLEVEAGYESIDYSGGLADDQDSSDLTLATVELGIDARLNDYITGHVLFLWEEDDTEPVDLDEGYITLRPGRESLFFLTAGKMYVPFGNFSTNMVSDPLTLEIGEARETAAQFGVEAKGFYGSVYLFNGDVDELDEDSHVDNFGANAGYAFETEAYSFDLGFGYINNILDSDGIEGVISDEGLDSVDSYVDGFAAHAVFSSGPFTLIGEYVTALDDTEYVNQGQRQKAMGEIAAWNIEFGYGFILAGRNALVGVAWQGSDKAENFLPEDRFMLTAGMDIFDGTSVALEYFHDEYENNDEVDTVTAQLAFEF
jgi:hypothetical protein